MKMLRSNPIAARASLPVLLLLLFMLTGGGPAATAGPPPSNRSMLVILLPGSTFSDWLRDATLRQLMDEGAVGLMNTRTARMPDDKQREPPDAAVLTLTAGARASVPGDEHFEASSDAAAAALWRQLIQSNVQLPPNSWIDPDWPSVLKANTGLGYDVRIGNLIDALRADHIDVSCRDGYPAYAMPLFGYGMLIAAGSDGRAQAAAGGISGLVFVDLGKTSAEIDGGPDPVLSAEVDAARRSHARILIISPFVDDRAYAAGDRLAPVLMLGDGVKPGLLYSPSTRAAGLITNTDIAPTIAAYFGTALPAAAVGRAISVAPSTDAVGPLERLRQSALTQRHAQRVLPYCAILLGLCLIALALRQSPSTLRALCALLPPALIGAAATAASMSQFGAGVAGIAVLLWLAARRGKTVESLLTIYSAISLAILVDAAFGGRFLKFALLGYSPIEGARYYGIGNEAMGAFVGVLLVIYSSTWNRRAGVLKWARMAMVVTMLSIVVIVGAPSMGAKAGGVIVLAGAFAIFLLSSRGNRLTFGRIAAATIAGMLLLGAMAMVDSAHPSASQSHLGAAVALIRHGGIGQAVDIAGRKLGVELKLAAHSTWALPVWAGLICLMLQRRAANASGDRPRIALADSALVASILMLLFNDAGAVACALCLSLVCVFLSRLSGPDVGSASTRESIRSY